MNHNILLYCKKFDEFHDFDVDVHRNSGQPPPNLGTIVFTENRDFVGPRHIRAVPSNMSFSILLNSIRKSTKLQMQCLDPHVAPTALQIHSSQA